MHYYCSLPFFSHGDSTSAKASTGVVAGLPAILIFVAAEC